MLSFSMTRRYAFYLIASPSHRLFVHTQDIFPFKNCYDEYAFEISNLSFALFYENAEFKPPVILQEKA